MFVRALMLCLSALVLLGPAAAHAQVEVPPAQDPALSPLVEALEVVARAPGPAVWRVTRGAGEVVILGTIAPFPHAQTWDDRRLRRNLAGARQLLASPRLSGGGRALLSFALSERSRLRTPAGSPLPSRLPPELAARFEGAARAARQPPSKYDRWKPAAAGFLLMADFDEAAGLSRAKPANTVTRLARTLKVPVRPTGKLDLPDLMRGLGRLDDAQHLACLEVALEQVERLASAPGELGRAWANADLRTVNRLYNARTVRTCPLLNPVIDRQVAETTALLDQALNTPGRTVALVDMSLLLQPGGVLDRLAGTGAPGTTRVDTP
jgi:hypothetical protein